MCRIRIVRNRVNNRGDTILASWDDSSENYMNNASREATGTEMLSRFSSLAEGIFREVFYSKNM